MSLRKNQPPVSRKLNRREMLRLTGLAGIGALAAACAAPAAPVAPKAADATAAPAAAPAAAGKAKLRLVVMDYDEKMKADTTALVEAYNKSQDQAEASLDVYSWGQGHDLLVTQISGGQAPDLCNVSAQWLGEWAAINEVAPLDKLPADFLANFVPSGIKAFTGTDGKLMGMPYFLDPRALFYRKDLIEKAPATFDDVIASATKVHKTPDMTGFGLTFAAKSDSLDYWWYAWFGVVGADGKPSLYDDNKKSKLGSPEAIRTTQFLVDLAQKHKVTNTDYATAGRDEELQPLFYAGKLAMLETGSWFPTLLKKNAPDLQVGLAPLPVAKAGIKPSTGFWPDSLIVFKQTKSADAASAMVQWMFGKDNRLTFAKQRGVIPERIDVGTDPGYAVGDTEKFFVEALKTAHNVYETPFPATFNKVQAEVETLIGRAVAGELSAADAMKQAAEFTDKTNGAA